MKAARDVYDGPLSNSMKCDVAKLIDIGGLLSEPQHAHTAVSRARLKENLRNHGYLRIGVGPISGLEQRRTRTGAQPRPAFETSARLRVYQVGGGNALVWTSMLCDIDVEPTALSRIRRARKRDEDAKRNLGYCHKE